MNQLQNELTKVSAKLEEQNPTTFEGIADDLAKVKRSMQQLENPIVKRPPHQKGKMMRDADGWLGEDDLQG